MERKKWTVEDDLWLSENYQKYGPRECSKKWVLG